MKKFIFSMIASTLTATTLIATPQAVVFDWGNVLATDDRSVVVNFICETLQFSEAEFETANLKKEKPSSLENQISISGFNSLKKKAFISLPTGQNLTPLPLKLALGQTQICLS